MTYKFKIILPGNQDDLNVSIELPENLNSAEARNRISRLYPQAERIDGINPEYKQLELCV